MRGVLAVVVAVVVLAAGAVVASAAGGPPDRDRGHGQDGGGHGPRGGHGHGGGMADGGQGPDGGHGGGGHGRRRPRRRRPRSRPRRRRPGKPPVKTPTAIGSKGAAATVDVLATDAAIDMLRKGGNAVDATVAAAGVLGVTEPFSAGIGGGGFMVIRTRHGKVTTIDGRETAPAAMRPDSFFENGAPLPFADARWSGLSAGVPGTVATWEYALERYGTKSLRKTLEAGIDVARRGFAVDQTFFDQTAPNVDYFDDIPSTAAIYLDPDGTPKDVGTTLRNPDMAKAYEMIARYGASGFYRGPIAKAIADAAQRPPIAPTANHNWRPGLITEDDIARYRAIERAPTAGQLQGPRRLGHGPAVERRLDRRRGAEHPRGLPAPRRGPHAGAAPLPRGLAPRRSPIAARYLADPDFIEVPLQCLLSKQFAAAPARADHRHRGQRARRRPATAARPASPSTITKGLSTTHLTVADDEGTVVSYTFTIESTGGNGIVVPGWGFLLNNELTDFDYDSHHRRQPRRGRQAPAQLDGAHDHHAPRQAGAGRRLAGRVDDHHHRPAGPARAARARQEPARGGRRAARLAAQHGTQHRRGGVHARPTRLRCPPRPRPRVRAAQAEIGAVTGIEFLPTAASSPRPSPCGAAAAARWWSRTASSAVPRRRRRVAARPPSPTNRLRADRRAASVDTSSRASARCRRAGAAVVVLHSSLRERTHTF